MSPEKPKKKGGNQEPSPQEPQPSEIDKESISRDQKKHNKGQAPNPE